MVETQPTWAKWIFGLIVAGTVAIIIANPFATEPEPEPAKWELDPEAALDSSSERVPILVNEEQCASGRSAEGRIVVSVDYRRTEVEFDVGVRPRGGDQECPSNPTTPYTVHEALGVRTIVGERPIRD